MIAALLLAGTCLELVVFDMTGPACSPERAGVECGCSECLSWDPDPNATSYEVNRETVSSGTFQTVGTVNGWWYTLDTGESVWAQPPALWCVGRDVPFPHEGVQYRYKYRGCNGAGCGPWSDPVLYVGAPYACFDGTGEIACYVGDSLATR